MLEQKLFQEELQNSGVHTMFGGLCSIPGEPKEIIAYFTGMEACLRGTLNAS